VAELVLGTVQLGLNYGVTNKVGPISDNQVSKISNLALKFNISKLDTSMSYGESESRIGEFFTSSKFEIISKINAKENYTRETFNRQLEKLRRPSIYGLLVHNTADFLDSQNYELFDLLKSLQESELVSKIGASVYSVDELERMIEVFPKIDLIQIPGNILNLNLLNSEVVSNLVAGGCEIHVRSIFLQGLLLSNKNQIHDFFKPLAPILEELDYFAAAHSMSRLEILLSAVKFNKNITGAVVGVTSAGELSAIDKAWRNAQNVDLKIDGYTVAHLLDPRNWPMSIQ
jgi:aryl-alcohol dehydrogenase-like predicted oxidoreductase